MDVWAQQSSLVTRNAAVCSDQPLATNIGIDILKQGGNAADAAVATMAAVSFLQPYSCGIGGDCHCLFYKAADKTIRSINGSGRTGKGATLEKIRGDGITDPQKREWFSHGHWVSVPGTVAGMCNIIEKFGSKKLTMKQILEPVIKLARDGAPVPYKAATMWKNNQDMFLHSKNAEDLLIDGKPPSPGDIITAPKLADCFQGIAESGAESFYCGNTAQQIAKEVQRNGGTLTAEDMKDHLTHPPIPVPSDALSIDFHGFRVWEMRPNTMGLIALVSLNVLKTYDLKALGHNSADYIHLITESLKYAYLTCWDYLCDPDYCSKSCEELLSAETVKIIRNKINYNGSVLRGSVPLSGGCDTSYVAAVDAEGNGCSFVCSVSSNFGTGIIPDDCGFVLHDRAKYMSLDGESNNAHGPYKLPLHSIIPALVTDVNTKELVAVMGVIGRWMQPQGHVQVLLNMVIFGMDPQVALNQPRFFVGDPRPNVTYQTSFNVICLEGGIDEGVITSLQKKGHTVRQYTQHKREIFGKGHVIARSTLFDKDSDARSRHSWWSGADYRVDSSAMGF
ncbi:glutathione hydrolase-like YwrD proenzyme [Parasteatoda tepidariorum]|uniref:glutathione hydrolase-like YwrD proenzyme n=1 Tax=Parasteatoda tepidariorum TaxID=114398 RepID=UPI001C71F20F|nr:glutathione hydrolase-like YwrD proenzyme [Parasteatoda tepidariorum]